MSINLQKINFNKKNFNYYFKIIFRFRNNPDYLKLNNIKKVSKNDSYKWVSSQLHEYARQNITFSTHVHIGLDDRDTIIKIMNIANGWISPMIALCANSPFFSGKKTGMQSSRTFQFGLFPRTNIIHNLKNYNEYMKIVNDLKSSGAIKKQRHIWWKNIH